MFTIYNNLEGNPQGILRVADGAWIPINPANSDYAAYLVWVAEGNTAEVTVLEA